MKIIIVGAGKVGYALASNLSREGHEVTIIDSSRHRLDNLEENLNVNTIHGNAARAETLHNANVALTDLVIAVTDKDELNMVTCFVAKNAGAKATVARVRTPGYVELDQSATLNALGVDMIINPEKVTAAEIVKLIDYPEASYVGQFGNGAITILELTVQPNCSQLDKPLMKIKFPSPCIIVGIERNGQLLIPRGDDRLQVGDEILLLADSEHMRQIEEFLNIHMVRPHYIAIVSGSLSGYYLAQMLEQGGRKYHVKLMEPNTQRATELHRELKNTIIINSNDINLFDEENIGAADVFISATEDDKENLFNSVIAGYLGANTTIAQIRSEYAALIEKAGVGRVVSPNRLTTDAILRFINRRSMLSLTRFHNSPGQIIEYSIDANAPAVGKALMELNFPHSSLICMISRRENGRIHHIIPGGKDKILAGDTVIVFSLPEATSKLEKLLTAAGGE